MKSLNDRAIEEIAPPDERRAALEHVAEAFGEALLAGIDGDCIAHAALFCAMQELVGAYGEEPVALFAADLPKRIRNGEFSLVQRH